MDKYESTLKNIGLQFFAEEGGEGSSSEDPTGTKQPEGGQDKGTGTQPGKTFTQEEVNRMLKAEKESAKKNLLKELGVEDAKSAKEGLAKYKEILDKDKTEAQKAQDDLKGESKARKEAETRAALAEAKVEVLSAGCKAEYLDDVITLAMGKVTDDKDLKTVVADMKKDPKYATFFGGDGSGAGDNGTGGGSGYHRKDGSGKSGSLGARLAGQTVAGRATENPYFKN